MARVLRIPGVGICCEQAGCPEEYLMMQDDLVTRVREHMDVEDADGDKIGTVRAIYQPAKRTSNAAGRAEVAGEAYLKVHSGLQLLGKDRYIPASAIRDVTTDRVILRIDESRVDEMGWDQRPAWISE
jgi:hypothetical protein